MSKKLTQEQMADKLGITTVAYSNIERGICGVSVKRLEEITEAMGADLIELLSLGENIVILSHGDNSPAVNSISFSQNINMSKENEKLSFDLQKANLIIEQRDKEVEYLKQQIADLREMVYLLKESNKSHDIL